MLYKKGNPVSKHRDRGTVASIFRMTMLTCHLDRSAVPAEACKAKAGRDLKLQNKMKWFTILSRNLI